MGRHSRWAGSYFGVSTEAGPWRSLAGLPVSQGQHVVGGDSVLLLLGGGGLEEGRPGEFHVVPCLGPGLLGRRLVRGGLGTAGVLAVEPDGPAVLDQLLGRDPDGP